MTDHIVVSSSGFSVVIDSSEESSVVDDELTENDVVGVGVVKATEMSQIIKTLLQIAMITK